MRRTPGETAYVGVAVNSQWKASTHSHKAAVRPFTLWAETPVCKTVHPYIGHLQISTSPSWPARRRGIGTLETSNWIELSYNGCIFFFSSQERLILTQSISPPAGSGSGAWWGAGNTGIHTSGGLPRTKHWPVRPAASADRKALQDRRKNRPVSSIGNSHSLVNLVKWQRGVKGNNNCFYEWISLLAEKTLVVIVLEERTNSQTWLFLLLRLHLKARMSHASLGAEHGCKNAKWSWD